MKALLSLALLVLSSTFSIAQNAPAAICPKLSVNGPPGLANLGEVAAYTATLVDENDYQTEFVWSVNGGVIRDGQGTKTVGVIRRADTLTVTVHVKGLPAGCPSSASVSATYDAAPDPIKFYELEPNAFFTARSVAAVMLEHPNNQLYILAGDVGRKNSPAFQKRQKSIIDLLSELGVTRDRITITPVYSDVELFQFWRVPPGANNPRCKECDELENARNACPSISVTGPADVTEPGDLMEFNGHVGGNIPANLTYRWSLSDEGEIHQGQGTLRLRVQTPRKSSFNIVATLDVLGLPAGCSNSATEAAPVTCQCNPLVVDEFRRLPRQDELARIDAAVAELRKRPGSKLVIIEHFPKSSSSQNINARFARLSSQLTRRNKLLPEEFEIVKAELGHDYYYTRIYVVPPGAENPSF